MTRALTLLAGPLALALVTSPAAAQAVAPSPPPPGYGSPYATSASTPMAPVAADESQDSGLGLEWVYVNADIGINSTSMDSLDSSNLSLKHTSSLGPAVAVGAGVRLLFFTAGVRARDLQLSDFSLWELDAEAAFHIRIDHVDPYFGVRGGYAFVGSLNSDAAQTAAGVSSPDVAIHGANVGLMFGLDYYFNHLVSLGIEGNPEFLFLQRPPVALPAGIPQAERDMIAQQPLYKNSGSSVGFGMSGTVHAGLHF